MGRTKSELLHGALALLVLRVVESGPMNGYAIGRRIDDLTEEGASPLSLEEGSLYPALYRMERSGWLASSWGSSENNRRAKFYRITPSGRKRLASEKANWASFARAVEKILESA